jgi:hypothetical protein
MQGLSSIYQSGYIVDSAIATARAIEGEVIKEIKINCGK